MNSCSCIFSKEDWDEVVTRCVKCQYIFENYDKIQKEEKVKRSGKKKRIVFVKRRNKIYIRKIYKFTKITVKIQANNELNVFVKELLRFSKMLKIRSCLNTLLIQKMLTH